VDWLQFVAQWLHVVLGIFWFGTTLAMNIIVIPAVMKLPLDRQREIGGAIGQVANRIMPKAAMGVIALGFLRGTVFGQIHSLDALTTTYGITWLVGLIAATSTFLWGTRVLEPALHRLNAIPVSDAFLPNGTPSPAMTTAMAAVKRVAGLELIGFVVVFTCMILMRFGY
jgi:uncharacterized membrane protein